MLKSIKLPKKGRAPTKYRWKRRALKGGPFFDRLALFCRAHTKKVLQVSNLIFLNFFR